MQSNSSLRQRLDKVRESPTAVAVVVALALFTDMLIYGLIIPLLPAILERMRGGTGGDTPDDKSNTDADDTWRIGFLFGLYALGLLLATPIFGYWSDQPAASHIASESPRNSNNRRMPMLVGTMGLALSTIFFAYADLLGWPWLAAARVLQGAAAGATWSVGLSMLADVYAPADLGVVMGTVLSANTVGFLIGPPVGGFLYQYVAPRAPFYLAAGLALLDVGARLFIRPRSLSHQQLQSDVGHDEDFLEEDLMDGARRSPALTLRSLESVPITPKPVDAQPNAQSTLLGKEKTLSRSRNYGSRDSLASSSRSLHSQNSQFRMPSRPSTASSAVISARPPRTLRRFSGAAELSASSPPARRFIRI